MIEWLAWQHQEIKALVEETPLLYTHADELDNNEAAEIKRVMDFLEIHGHAHTGEAVMTAKVGCCKLHVGNKVSASVHPSYPECF